MPIFWYVGDTVSAGTLSSITGAAAGTVTNTGTGAATLSHITGSASGTVSDTGTAAGTLSSITGAATGTVSVPNIGAGTLKSITGSASGTVTNTGTAAGTLKAITGSATGSAGANVGAGTLKSITGAASGLVTNPGTASGTLKAITGSATGSSGQSFGIGTLQAITGAGIGTVIVTGTGAGTLQAIRVPAVSGVPFRVGTLLGSARSGGTIYLKDVFAGTDGVSINARPMTVGPGWSIASGGNFGSWVIDSGRARETGTLPITASIAISDAGVNTGINVGATVNVPAIVTDSAVGVLARMSADFQNGWLAWVDVFDQRIVISERTSGFFVLRAQLPAVLSYDTDYSVTLTCSGSVFTLTVAGVGAISYTSSANLGNTNFGIYGDSAPGQFVSNFLVASTAGGTSGDLIGG